MRFNLGKFNRISGENWFLPQPMQLKLTATADLTRVRNPLPVPAEPILLTLQAAAEMQVTGKNDQEKNLQGGFNRQKFNKGKFNRRIGGGKTTVNFIGVAQMGLTAAADIGIIRGLQANATLQTATTGDFSMSKFFTAAPAVLEIATNAQITRVQPLWGSSLLQATANAKITRLRNYTASPLLRIITTAEPFYTFVYEHIELTGLSLAPGAELRIDMDKMTAEINRLNAIKHLTPASDFWLINPSPSPELTTVNEITYTATPAVNAVNIKILWKDAYL